MIRQATKADISEMVANGKEFADYFPVKRPYNEDLFCKILDILIDKGIVLVDETEGHLVGAAIGTLQPVWYSPESKSAALLAWVVKPNHRRGMVGIRLLKAFEQKAAEMGADAVVLGDYQVDGDFHLDKLIRRMGYKIVERAHYKEVRSWQKVQ